MDIQASLLHKNGKKTMSSLAAVNSRSVFLQGESHAERDQEIYVFVSTKHAHFYIKSKKKFLHKLVICKDTLIFKT